MDVFGYGLELLFIQWIVPRSSHSLRLCAAPGALADGSWAPPRRDTRPWREYKFAYPLESSFLARYVTSTECLLALNIRNIRRGPLKSARMPVIHWSVSALLVETQPGSFADQRVDRRSTSREQPGDKPADAQLRECKASRLRSRMMYSAFLHGWYLISDSCPEKLFQEASRMELVSLPVSLLGVVFYCLSIHDGQFEWCSLTTQPCAPRS